MDGFERIRTPKPVSTDQPLVPLARRRTGVKNGTGQGHHGPPDRWGAQPQGAGQLARAAARRKIAQLEEALEGAEFFTPAHAALLAKVLARIDRLSADIEDLTAVIEQLLAPYEEQLAQAESMPGWGRRAAQDAVAETGIDMTRFRTGPHLVSWGGRAPQDHQSGQRKGRAKAKKEPHGPRRGPAVADESWVPSRRGRACRLVRARGLPVVAVAAGRAEGAYSRGCAARRVRSPLDRSWP